jgi:hypothetical protein
LKRDAGPQERGEGVGVQAVKRRHVGGIVDQVLAYVSSVSFTYRRHNKNHKNVKMKQKKELDGMLKQRTVRKVL